MLPLAVLLSSLMIGSASADVPVCAQAFGSFSAQNYPGACWRPYSSSSPFNRPLPADPAVASDSGAVVAGLTANDVNFEGGGSQFALTSDDGRDGVYYSRPADPIVTIHCTYHWGPGTCTGTNKVNVDARQIHVPAGAQPQDNGTDMHMSVVDQADDVEYDFEHASWSADHSTLNVWSGAEIPAGPNLGSGLGGGGTAAGFSTLAGLITEPELASGTINHALVINVPCSDSVVYPAAQANGLPCSQMQGRGFAGTSAPLGSLLQLNMTDAQIATSGAPAWEKTIMTAMAHYGMYVNDTDGIGDIELEAESDISYTSLGGPALLANFIAQQGGWYYSPLNRWIMAGPAIPVTRLRVIDPCWAQGLCPGAATAPNPTAPATTPVTPPATVPVTPGAPAGSPATTAPASTATPAATPPTPVAVAVAPAAAPKPAPAKSPPSRHNKKNAAKTRKSAALARTATVRRRATVRQHASVTSHATVKRQRAATRHARRRS